MHSAHERLNRSHLPRPWTLALRQTKAERVKEAPADDLGISETSSIQPIEILNS
jgi:hypothetical protein